MDKRFILKLALRNLAAHRLRAILTLIGVAIGIGAIVFLVSFTFGLERLVTNEVSNGDAFRLIDVGTGDSQIITLSDASAVSLKNISGVVGVYGMTAVGASLQIKDKSMDVSFYGDDQSYLDKAGVLLSQGARLSGKGREILVNNSLLQFLKANGVSGLGQEVTFNLVIPKGLSSNGAVQQIPDQTYRIVGIVNNNAQPMAYTDYLNLRQAGVAGFTQFKVEVKDKNMVNTVRKQIENLGFKTQYVGDTVTQINQIFSVFRLILGTFGLVTLFVAILGMFNTLTISLLERIKEVALMKMLGISRQDINNIFLAESVILGLSGGILGILIGIFSGELLNLVLDHYAQSMGGPVVGVFYTPISFIIAVLFVSLLIGIITGLYPARHAVKVKALDVLRYE